MAPNLEELLGSPTGSAPLGASPILLGRLLSPAIVCLEGVPGPPQEYPQLFPEELAALAGCAASRAAQYAASRTLAHQAFRELGVPVVPLLNRADRSPVWPSGCTGSVSHTVSLCAVAVARSTSVRSIGIDLELDTPLSEKLLSRVLSPHEFSALRASERQAGIALPEIAKLVFSAKESAYKCQYPVTQTFLGFHDAECDVNWESETFAIRIVAPSAPLGSLAGEPGAPLPADFRLRGRFSRGNGHWATVVLLT